MEKENFRPSTIVELITHTLLPDLLTNKLSLTQFYIDYSDKLFYDKNWGY